MRMKDTTWKIGIALLIVLVSLVSFESPVRDWLDQRGFPLLGPEIKSAEADAKIDAETCSCGSNSVCMTAKRVLEQKCADLTESCGESCVGTNDNAKSCGERKNKLFEEREWYQTNCVDDGCGLPLEPCCDVEPVGACCRIYDDGTYDCDSDKTELECTTLAEDEEAVDSRWHEGQTCEEVNCGIGACCITIAGSGGGTCSAPLTQCYARFTNLRCQLTAQQIEINEGRSTTAIWHYGQTCGEVRCSVEGCQAQLPEAKRAESQEQCLRLVCPWNPEACWAWFTEPDDTGCICCGPV